MTSFSQQIFSLLGRTSLPKLILARPLSVILWVKGFVCNVFFQPILFKSFSSCVMCAPCSSDCEFECHVTSMAFLWLIAIHNQSHSKFIFCILSLFSSLVSIVTCFVFFVSFRFGIDTGYGLVISLSNPTNLNDFISIRDFHNIVDGLSKFLYS